MKATKFELPFAMKKQLNKDTYTFYFDRSIFKFDYLAGQYFRVTLNLENPDNRGSSRYFTQSSSPTDEFLTITTRIVKSSFKLKLNSLSPGEKITFFGPFGDVVQTEKDLTPKILLAGGIGMTPAHSMLRYIDAKKIKVDFALFVSFPTASDVIFYDELREIQKRNPSISLVYCLTKEKNIPGGFEKGRINNVLIKKYAKNFNESKIFITGPIIMAKAMEEIVKNMGAKQSQIIFEDFPGY